MGTYILILMFVLVAIAVTFATYNLSMIKSMPPEERYKLLYFKDDQVSIGIGLVRRTYKLKIFAKYVSLKAKNSAAWVAGPEE